MKNPSAKDIFDPDSPDLVLPVTMRFADTQPAPKGLMLVHCGGPGSGANCVHYTYGSHLQDRCCLVVGRTNTKKWQDISRQ